MSSRTASIALTLALLAATSLSSANTARVITFDEAVRIGLEQNSDLRQAEISSKVNGVAVDQARGRFYPDLTVSSRGAQSFGRNFNEAEGRVIDTKVRTASLGVSSSVTVFDGFGNTAGLKEAQLTEQGGKQDLERTRETVVFTVASNFLALVQQQEELRVRRESLAAESALEQQIANYVDAGARTIADLYQQQASVASARLAVVEAERAAQLAEVDLISTLQLDPAGSYQFERPDYDTTRLTETLPDLDAMLASAYERRVDLHAEESRVEAAKQAVRVAKSGRWPQLSLSTSYGSSYTDQSDFGLLDQFDQRRGGSIGLGVTIPIFDRGDTRAAIRRAELDADSAEIALETHRHQIGVDVRTAYQDFRAAREQLSSADVQLKAAELALKAAQDRYEAGAATLVELTQARTTHVEAASALVQAKSNLVFQRTLVDYFTGALEIPPAS